MKIFAIIFIVLLCFAACGKEVPAQPTQTQPVTTEAVTEPTQVTFTVQVLGEAKTGAVVYAAPSKQDVNFTYRWYIDGQVLPAAAGDMLVIPLSAAGKQLTVTAEFDGYTAESQPVTVTQGEMEQLPMAAIAHDAKLYGRCSTGLGLYLDFSASGFELNVESKGNPMSIEYLAGYDLYVAVFVDGKLLDRPLLPAGTGTLTIPLTAGQHTVMVLKETEVQTNGNTLQLMNMLFDGTILEKPADRPLYMEVIGDSIACGDGSLGKYTAGQKWVLQDHSGTHGFAYLTAQKIGADWSVFARGGIGLMKPAGEYTAGQMYPYVNLYRDKVTRYTPARTPDIVIVELGANDDKNDTAAFVAAYNSLVDQIRALYGPDVKIVWTGKNYNQYNSAQYVAKEREDPNMFAFQFAYGGSGSAALATQSEGHPDAAEQQAFADALAGYLQKYVLGS